MLVNESANSFSLSSLQQLSCELATPEFIPTNAQKAVLSLALKLLDLELSHQSAEYPELVVGFSKWLEEHKMI